MNQPDQLPALQIAMPVLQKHRAFGRPLTFDRGPYEVTTSTVVLDDLIKAGYKAGQEAERARADALQAELDAEKETTANLLRALREETEGPTFMGEPVLPPIYARADALEAALKELVAALDSPRFKTSVSSRYFVAMAAARALLEKKT